MKRCLTCGEEKELDQFSKNSRAKDLKQQSCKSCNREVNRKFRERRPEYQKKY